MGGLLRWLGFGRAREVTFPVGWAETVRRNVPLCGRLLQEDREELERLIRAFLARVDFEGCGGLEITDEIRITIAAQACLLLLHRDADRFPGVTTVLVYPGAYVAEGRQWSADGVVSDGPMARLGESWHHGPVILAWDDVRASAADIRDGHSVVFHEFAHKLDEEDGALDGAPLLERRSMYVAWARILGREYEQLLRDSTRGRRTVLNRYGAENPVEFFAVATECFFEKPARLKRKHPELYAELAEFYRQDPVALLDSGGARE